MILPVALLHEVHRATSFEYLETLSVVCSTYQPACCWVRTLNEALISDSVHKMQAALFYNVGVLPVECAINTRRDNLSEIAFLRI